MQGKEGKKKKEGEDGEGQGKAPSGTGGRGTHGRRRIAPVTGPQRMGTRTNIQIPNCLNAHDHAAEQPILSSSDPIFSLLLAHGLGCFTLRQVYHKNTPIRARPDQSTPIETRRTRMIIQLLYF